MKRLSKVGLSLFLTVAAAPVLGGPPQQAGDAPATTAVEPSPGGKDARVAMRPLTEGPLHESFLSPRRDRAPRRVEKSPPPSVIEHPALDPPNSKAVWIEGYWEWDADRKDFVWVTGSWRVPPPGRFWVNGYWKRDDKGWYRVTGFWSDRKTDRIDYRKDGPPAFRPDDDPGEPPSASAATDYFYVPGEYHPDGDGVVWKKGFWADAKPGWSWVPASWTHQPEGWMFQEGYWDRTLEDRGILFAPAEMAGGAKSSDDLTYQPYTIISPELYGQLYGAIGRPNSYYDGYPGVYYDDDGRYYGYADYGNLSCYYGYLDYPFYGGYGYPYYVAPLTYASYSGLGYGYPYYGSLLGGALGLGFGYPLSPFLPYGYNGLGGYGGYGVYSWGGLGYGYPYSGLGYGGYGWGGGYGGFGNWGGFGFPGWGLGGYGLLAWQFGGLGLGSFGFPGLGFGFGGLNNNWNNLPYQNSGRHHMANGGRSPNAPNGGRPGGNGGQGGVVNRPGNHPAGSNVAGLPSRGFMRTGPGLASAGLAARHGVQPPPSSRPFASLASHHATTGIGAPGALQNASMRTSGTLHNAAAAGGSWNHAFNGVSRPAVLHHASARPAFTNTNNAGAVGARGGMASQGAGGVMAHQGTTGSFVPQMRGATAGAAAANPALGGRAHAGNPWLGGPSLGAPGGGRPAAGMVPQTHAFTAPHAAPGNFGAMRGGAMGAPSMGGGFNAGAMRGGAMGGSLGSGFNGGFNAGGMRGGGMGGFGGMSGGGMHAGGMGGGTGSIGGMRGGGFSPGSMGGGFGGGAMHGGGMGGGFGGGMGGGMGGMHGGGGGGGHR